MEGYCSTGQSPQQAVVPVEEEVGRETAQNKYVQTNNVDAEENFAPLG
jgi:hypothetical protein